MSTPEQPEHEAKETSSSPESGAAENQRPADLQPGELDELRAAFELGERRRRRRALLGGGLVLVGLVVFFWVMITYGDTEFQPQVEQGEQNVLAETNDPVCRGVIAQVTEVGEAFFEQETSIERALVSDDRAKVVEMRSFLEKQREVLGGIEDKSEAAVLRYDVSRAELDRWFAFVDTEYGQLISLANRRVELLDGEEGGEPDAEAKKAEAAALDLQGRALLALHESFHSFRVWHSSSLHPCGRSASELIPEIEG